MTAPRLAAPAPATHARTGVWVGIAAITMSFAAYTSALLVRRGDAADWPGLHLPSILYLNTLILAGSSLSLAAGQRRLKAGWKGGVAVPEGAGWLRLTLGLGLLFVAGQLLAWRQLASQGVFLASSPASSFFYVLTVLHAIHLLGGVGGMTYVIGKVRRRGAGPAPAGALDAAVLYWHFMGVLWLYLLGLLILL